jgi:hypothetical protein
MAFGQYVGIIVGVIGAIVGGVIGSVYPGVGTTAGAMWGFSIGSMVGGIAGQMFWPEKADVNTPPPPQPHETRVQFSSWGMPIPIQYGDGRLAGNIIYMSPITETIERSKHRQDGVRYYEMVKTYTATFAIAFCEGPVLGVVRLWMNNKVFADWRDTSNPYYPVGDYGLVSANLDTTIARAAAYFSVYLGSETQTADPSMVALLTDAEVPAYRGMFYIVFKDFPIGEFSGVPNIEVEVGYPVAPMWVSDDFDGVDNDPPKTWLWLVEADSCYIKTNKLLLISSAVNLAPRVTSIIEADGDFDVEVDYVRETAYFAGFGIELTSDVSGYHIHYRMLAQWTAHYITDYWEDDGHHGYLVNYTDPADYGKMRVTKIRRSAPNDDVCDISFYFKNTTDPDWTLVGTWTNLNNLKWTLSFVMVGALDYYVESVSFDNFTVV